MQRVAYKPAFLLLAVICMGGCAAPRPPTYESANDVVELIQSYLVSAERPVDGPMLERMVQEAEQPDWIPPQIARMRAYQLALSGHTPASVAALRRRGLDLVAIALKSPHALTLGEKTALSEATAIATVIHVHNALEPGDGFRSSAVFRVEEVLSGQIPESEIVLRRYGGPDSSGGLLTFHEFDGDVGDSFIVFPSHNAYRFSVLYPMSHYGRLGDVRPDLQLEEYPNYVLNEYMAIPLTSKYRDGQALNGKLEAELEEARRIGKLRQSVLE